MCSDAAYADFLDQANQDPGAGQPVSAKPSSSSSVFKATEQGADIPAPLRACSHVTYMSDADEPFEPVCLDLEGGELPDEESFVRLIHHPNPSHAAIEILDPVDWDKRGHYKTIIAAVREAGRGRDIRVYRVEREGSRVEYWVVTIDVEKGKAKGRLVGAKALAVES